MIYSNWKDFGGSPGFHLAFIDYCEQKEDLAALIAEKIVDEINEIQSASVVKHSIERNAYDTGKPWTAYVDGLEVYDAYEAKYGEGN